jgi:hypothetical protein
MVLAMGVLPCQIIEVVKNLVLFSMERNAAGFSETLI